MNFQCLFQEQILILMFPGMDPPVLGLEKLISLINRFSNWVTEEKDYIMRMIADFMRVISRVLFLKETKQYYDAVTELDNLNKMISGFSLEQIKNLGVEGFKYVYDLDKKADVEKIFCAARILKE